MGLGIKAHFQGRLARDPELRNTNDGTEVCGFSVAVDRSFQKDKNNKIADFPKCTAWRGTGVAISKYFRKGDGIIIDGELVNNRFVDNDGNNRDGWEIVVSGFEFPFGKGGGNHFEGAAQIDGNYPATSDFASISEEDGELPF